MIIWTFKDLRIRCGLTIANVGFSEIMSSKVSVYCINFREKLLGGGEFITDTPLLFTNKGSLGWNGLVKFAKLVGLSLDGKRSIYTTMNEVVEDSNARIIPEIQIKGTRKLQEPEKVMYDLSGRLV